MKEPVEIRFKDGSIRIVEIEGPFPTVVIVDSIAFLFNPQDEQFVEVPSFEVN